MTDGYVKYNAQHTKTPAIEVPLWAELNDARSRLHELGLVGVTKEGIGYGNVSIRYKGNEFLVSGTATGALPKLSVNDYCLVKSFDIERNMVVTMGPVEASSEAMTHGAVYQSCPAAGCVMHIHSRKIFDGMLRDKYPSTPLSAEYGTQGLALAIAKCAEKLGDEGAIVLAGHDEGVIVYGTSVEKVLKLVNELYNKYN